MILIPSIIMDMYSTVHVRTDWILQQTHIRSQTLLHWTNKKNNLHLNRKWNTNLAIRFGSKAWKKGEQQ